MFKILNEGAFWKMLFKKNYELEKKISFNGIKVMKGSIKSNFTSKFHTFVVVKLCIPRIVKA